MNDHNRYMTPKDVADLFQVPVKTVAHWRTNRSGPVPQRYGRHVRYLEADVEAWAEEVRRQGQEWMEE